MLAEIANGVFVSDEYTGGAVGLVLSERGNLLVDTPMLPPDARQWRLAIMRMNDAPIYGIVNTDYHPEHFLGNVYLGPTRTFGHELAAKPIAKYETSLLEQIASAYRDESPALAEEILHTEIRQPEICVDDRITLFLGNRQVEALYLEGHTPASLGLYLREERLLFAGDNITHNQHPAMYQANSLAWLDTLRRIKAMEIDTIVTGTGELCDKTVIDPIFDYISEMHRRVTALFDKGASRRECVDKVGMLDWFPVPDEQAALMRRRRRGNVERVYTEIRIARKRKKR